MIVTIIGGGPCGLGAARAFKSEGLDVQIFEAQPGYGGAWRYTGKGPMYRDLTTNITSELMMYQDVPFKGPPGYKKHTEVFDYVDAYSKSINAKTYFNTRIVDVRKEGSKWIVVDENGNSYSSDFLVVASGHLDFPYTPSVPGLDEWKAAEPQSIQHSRFFDNPDGFEGKTVVVVGNAASGIDLAIQILPKAKKVYVSRREVADSDALWKGYIDVKPAFDRVDVDTHTVHFRDDTSAQVDVILYCTGYRYEIPFLDNYSNSQKYPVLDKDRRRLHNLYRHIFSIEDPTLAFISADKKIVPMPMSETQGAVAARVFAGRLKLPPFDELLSNSKELGPSGDYHTFDYPHDATYMDGLQEWSRSAGGDLVGEKWTPEKRHQRDVAAAVKLEEFKQRIANYAKSES